MTRQSRHTAVRVFLLVAGLAFLGQIIYASLQVSLFEQGPLLTGLVWGQVTLVDLYLGFIVALLLLWHLEPKRLYVLVFGLLFLFLGNWLLCWYLAWRWPQLRGLSR
ncbi:MAG: hypothetical protein LAT62_01595 [Natronospirillum sp.]|uniref:hypothetical protein n=1 Tax=Natronospirillum sp. TaxID=2812955 RepID=UPI0025EAB838|nr:hypothetical protein [Natronospirillum sp.]MCH8550598.1 hypothetical protein [Natronospirillum sp.]